MVNLLYQHHDNPKKKHKGSKEIHLKDHTQLMMYKSKSSKRITYFGYVVEFACDSPLLFSSFGIKLYNPSSVRIAYFGYIVTSKVSYTPLSYYQHYFVPLQLTLNNHFLNIENISNNVVVRNTNTQKTSHFLSATATGRIQSCNQGG